MESERLVVPSYMKEIMEKYQFRFKRRFGQNFLIDRNILMKIVASAQLNATDYVIEIGTGLGSLTTQLAHQCKQVISFEIDRDLVLFLQENIDQKNIRIVAGDAMAIDWRAQLVQRGWTDEPVKLVANLPYYLTTPLVMQALEGNVPFASVTVMVQQEVADRMMAKPATKEYGVLSLAVQYYSDPILVAKAPRTVFMPSPDVDSTVIQLLVKEPVTSVPVKALFQVIKAAFGQRRKTIKNSLRSLIQAWGISGGELDQVLMDLDIAVTCRGEVLSLEQFCDLTQGLLALAGR